MLKYSEPTVEKPSSLTCNDRFGFGGGKCVGLFFFLFSLGRSPSKSDKISFRSLRKDMHKQKQSFLLLNLDFVIKCFSNNCDIFTYFVNV